MTPSPDRQRLEREVLLHTIVPDDAVAAQISAAVSLKRIADALEKHGGKSHFERIFG